MSTLLHESVKKLDHLNAIHDPLAYMKDAIDWSVFPSLLKDPYHNDAGRGGRPNIPVTTMVKILFLQNMFNVVDEQAEKEIRDRSRS
ncbi:MAG: transposase [Candidatus Thermoplasmatota archaeon]|nr:transposase [Candidatus Thermoplasmatota archaeon]MCL5438021.1 transposase [Candidatus Thermoplasmatota archaeon]